MLGYLALYSRHTPVPGPRTGRRSLFGILPHEIAALSRRAGGRNA